MFVIIKVKVPIDLKLFQGTLEPLQARRIKKNYRAEAISLCEKSQSQ